MYMFLRTIDMISLTLWSIMTNFPGPKSIVSFQILFHHSLLLAGLDESFPPRRTSSSNIWVFSLFEKVPFWRIHHYYYRSRFVHLTWLLTFLLLSWSYFLPALDLFSEAYLFIYYFRIFWIYYFFTPILNSIHCRKPFFQHYIKMLLIPLYPVLHFSHDFPFNSYTFFLSYKTSFFFPIKLLLRFVRFPTDKLHYT